MQLITFGRFCAALAASCLLSSSVLFVTTAYAQEARYHFDLPAQPLSQMLRDFAQISGTELVFTDDLVAGRKGAALKGDFTPATALAMLLNGTGLVAEPSSAGVLMIRKITIAQSVGAKPATGQLSDSRNGPGTAPAEEPQNHDGSVPLEEVMVTAQRRQERAQDVPVSITVLNNEAIRERHIESDLELAAVVPSMNVSTGSVRGGETYAIRGQGVTLGGGPGVVVYFAEVPLPQGNLASISQGGGPGLYYDLQNIQVLAGPQGTLFGRNTTGGAVLIEPNRPKAEFGGYLQGQYGSYNDRELEAAVNVPLVPGRLLLRVAGKFVERNGFTTDVVTGKQYDDRNYGSTRIGLLFTPTDRIENYLLFNGIFSHDHGSSTVPIAENPTGLLARLYPGGVYAALLAAQRARGPREVSLSAPLIDREHMYGATDIFKFDIADGLVLRNIASYMRFQYLANQDADASPLKALDVSSPLDVWNTDTANYTEELQLQGKSFDDRLEWVAGGYGEYDKPVGLQTQQTTQFQASPFTVPSGTIQSQDYTEIRRSRALYLQGSYDLGGLSQALEHLKLTAGYRYTWDSKHNTTDAALPLQNFACVTFPGLFRPNCTLAVSSHSQAPTWTIGLDYKLTPDVLLYAKTSKGYKTGGANATVIDPSRLTFKPEYVEDIEIGFKSAWELLGMHGLLNADVYHDNYSDIQRTGSLIFNGKSGSITVNAGKATIRGVEAQASIFPFDSLELAATYSYMDAKYDRFLFGTVDLTNEPFAFAPRNKYSLTTRYSLPLPAQTGTLKGSLTYSYTDKWYTAVTSIEQTSWVPGYGLLDLRLGVDGVAGLPLDVTGFVTNLTNKEYHLGAPAYYNTVGHAITVFGEPRMVGVQLNYHF